MGYGKSATVKIHVKSLRNSKSREEEEEEFDRTWE